MKQYTLELKTLKRKSQLLKWIKRYNRLPSYRSLKSVERKMGRSLENYMSKTGPSYDEKFRTWILANFPRKVTNKRKHDKKARVKELVNFLKVKSRSPSVFIPEERKLARMVYNYAAPNGSCFDPKVQNLVYKLDPCFGTQVPRKYRQSINTHMNGSVVKVEQVFLEQQTKNK